jgi:hypothetical protein
VPILREETKVQEYIEQLPKELTQADINDVWLVIFLAVVVYVGSNFISVILKFLAAMTIILGLVTILDQNGLWQI